MSHEKRDFPNCSGPDKLAGHRLHGTDATSNPAATAEQIGDGFAGQLFQGMRHDPSVPLTDFATRDFSPSLARWMNQEPAGYVDGLNWYNAPVDEPVNPINPLGT